MRAIVTAKPVLIQEIESRIDQSLFDIGQAHTSLCKSAGDAKITHSLVGKLYLSESGWLLLSVPAALVRGAFQCLDEHGVELPLDSDGKLTPHISVMNKEEVDKIGTDKITERGKAYNFTLGPIRVVSPDGWKEISKCYFIEVKSKDLEKLRKSYGLTPIPHNDEYPFHITFGVIKKNVLRNNEVSKAASLLHSLSGKKMDTDVKARLKQSLFKYSKETSNPKNRNGFCIIHQKTVSVIHGLFPKKTNPKELIEKLINNFENKSKGDKEAGLMPASRFQRSKN